MATFYVMEAATLYRGDETTSNRHLTLETMKLPVLEENFQEHTPGGSIVGLEVGVSSIKALELTFKLKGWDPDLLGAFGLSSRVNSIYTAYGVIRDRRSGRAIEAKAVAQARLGKIEADEFKRGDLQGHDYALKEVVRYELYFDGRQKFLWDFFTQEFYIDGVSQNADELSILRINRA